MTRIKKIVFCSLFLLATSILTSCGTVNGFGKDVSHAGQDIQRASSH